MNQFHIIILVLLAGLGMGAAAVLFVKFFDSRRQIQGPDTDMLVSQVKDSVRGASFDAMRDATAEFQRFAAKDLEGKKGLIDQTLGEMRDELKRVQQIVSNFEKDREQKFGELATQLKSTAEQTSRLQDTAGQLKNVLVSTAARGQWGNRMAEDILRLAGFIEGINYKKEKSQDTVSTRPDYTFLLPQGLKLNMDVKFPLSNYVKFTEVASDIERARYKEQFLRDVRLRVKEVTGRDYINPAENTVDYVIVFIPNEQAYSFINEHDRALLDEALRSKVIVCSPLTLYAILAVIRQAVDNFNLEKTASEILSLLGAFYKQWDAFIKSFDKLGKRIDDVREEYDNLTSTRRNQLERPIKKIDDLRRQKGIPEAVQDISEEPA